MTQGHQLRKWFIYGLGLIPVWILDAYLLPYVPVFGVVPLLLPLAVVCVAMLEGAYAGAGFGLFVGLWWELAYPGGFGGLVLGMALSGMLVGAVTQYALRQSFFTYVLCCGSVLAVLDGLRLLWALFIQIKSIDVLIRVILSEILLSLVWTPLVYWIFRGLYRRVGGTRLA